MVSRFIKINGITRDDRQKVIGELNEAISKSGAWILNFKMFSNTSINLLFEMPIRNVHLLHLNLSETNVKLYSERNDLLKDIDSQQKQLNDESTFDMVGTLAVTFIHNDPDLIIEVPPFDL